MRSRGDVSQPSNGLHPETEERIKTYLSPWKDAALAIRILLGHGRVLTCLKNMIYPHLSQCYRINLTFHSADLASPMLPLPGYLPRLNELLCTIRGIEATASVLFQETDHMARPRYDPARV